MVSPPGWQLLLHDQHAHLGTPTQLTSCSVDSNSGNSDPHGHISDHRDISGSACQRFNDWDCAGYFESKD